MEQYIKLSTQEYPINVEVIKNDPVEMLDYALVNVDEIPTYDATRYYLSAEAPQQINGEWRQQWLVVEKPINDVCDRIRQERNLLLSQSDWTQVSDAPVDKQAWAVYRQALRDITMQPGFPWEVQWPETP